MGLFMHDYTHMNCVCVSVGIDTRTYAFVYVYICTCYVLWKCLIHELVQDLGCILSFPMTVTSAPTSTGVIWILQGLR